MNVVLKRKNGEQLLDTNGNVVIVKKLSYNGTWMGESFVSVDIESPCPIEFSVGDYLEYRGEPYYINYEPESVKSAKRNTVGNGFKYSSIKFASCSDEMTRCSFLDYVINDNSVHFTFLPEFSFYAASVKDLADRLQANMDRLYVGSERWHIKVLLTDGVTYYDASNTNNPYSTVDGSSTGIYTDDDFPGEKNLNVSASNIMCWDALAMARTQFLLNFIIKGRTVQIGTNGLHLEHVFEYGKGNGLKQIAKTSDSSQQIVTRLHAFGSDKNLPLRYYANKVMCAFFNLNDCAGKGTYDNTYNKAAEFYFFAKFNYDINPFTYQRGDHYVVILSHGGKRVKARLWVNDPDSHYCHVGCHAFPEQSESFKDSDDTYDNIVSFLQTYSDRIHDEQDMPSEYRYDFSGDVIIDGYVNKDHVPVSHKRQYEDVSISADHMSVTKLMLPGFPLKSVYDAAGGASQAKFDYSTDNLNPYIGKNVDTLGVREASVVFDKEDKENGIEEIYPTIKEMTAGDAGISIYSNSTRLDEIIGKSVNEDGSDITDDGVFVDEGETIPPFTIKVRHLGFNLDDELSRNEYKIVMQDGMCGSREFPVVSAEQNDDESWTLTCSRSNDSGLERYFPYKGYEIKPGDHFVIIDIELPEVYIEAASMKLLRCAKEYLAKNCNTKFCITPSVDNIWMARQHEEAIASGETSIHDVIKEGDMVFVKDSDLNIEDGTFVTIDSIVISEGEESIPQYEITLKDEKTVGTIQKIQNQIEDIKSGKTGIGWSSDEINAMVNAFGSKKFLSKIKDDSANGLITFLKGIAFGNPYGIGYNGDAILNNILAKEGDFSESIITKNLTVTGLAHFFELVIDKVSSIGGAVILTPASGFVADYVDEYKENGALVGYNVYWRNTDGNGKAIDNQWMVGDFAYCQSFNIQEGSHGDVVNKLYWCAVSAVDTNVRKAIEGVTYQCNMIRLDVNDKMSGCTVVPSIGDSIVMLGSRAKDGSGNTITERQSALYLSSYNSIDAGYIDDQSGKALPALKAPFMAQYKGINDFNLAKHRKSYYDATGAHIIGSLTVESSGKTVEQMIEENSAKGISLNTATLVIASNEYGDPYDITPIVITAETGMDGSFTWEIELHSGTKVTPKSEIPVSWYSISGNTLTITSEGITKLCEGYYEQVKVACSMTYESETYPDAINLQIVSDGENGEGKDAVNFIVNPSSLIFETNRDGSISGDKSITISAKRGSKDITDFSVSCLSTTNCVALPGHNNHSFAISIPSRFFQEVTGISGTYKIPPSSGMARFTATIDGVVYYIDVPFVVNLKSVFNSFIVDVNQFKSVYEAFVYNADGSVKEFGTTLKQTAEGISASAQEETEGKLEESGIDINAKRIVAHTGNFVVANNAEGTNPYMTVTSSGIQANNITIDGTGTFKGKLEAATGTFSGALNGANGYFSGFVRKKKTVITSSNFSTYFTYDSSSEWWYPKYSKLANWIYLEYLPEDDTTIVMGKFGTGIQDDDLRELVGTTFLIYNKSGKTLLITGDLNITGSVFSSVPLANGYMMYLECRVSSVNGVENISWYVVSAKIRV